VLGAQFCLAIAHAARAARDTVNEVPDPRVSIVLLTIRLAPPLHVNASAVDAHFLFHAVCVAQLLLHVTAARLKVVGEAAVVGGVVEAASAAGNLAIIRARVAVERRSVVDLRRVLAVVVGKDVLRLGSVDNNFESKFII
jgi:hypothetical protein